MKRHALILGALLLIAPVAANAQQKGAIEVRTVAEVEVVQQNAKGEKVTVRKEASKAAVVPDSVVIFTTTYTNKGKQPATGVAITNPVPKNMAYLEGTAEGKDTKVQVSVDYGKTYGLPGAVTVKDSAGKSRKATAADYTTIKWTRTTALAPGASGTVTFRARVL